MGRAIYLEDNASVVEAALLKNKTHIPEDLTNTLKHSFVTVEYGYSEQIYDELMLTTKSFSFLDALKHKKTV